MNEDLKEKLSIAGLLALIFGAGSMVFVGCLLSLAMLPLGLWGVYVTYLWAVVGIKPTFFGFFCMFLMGYLIFARKSVVIKEKK